MQIKITIYMNMKRRAFHEFSHWKHYGIGCITLHYKCWKRVSFWQERVLDYLREEAGFTVPL